MIAGFRTQLWLAMMLIVSAVTALGLFFAQRNMAANVERDFQREFQDGLSALHAAQAVRHALLAERCRALARKPRLHAALEDNALDLLYPSARDELADVMGGEEGSAQESAESVLHARYYRFLNARGAVISPPEYRDAGRLPPEEEARLGLKAVPDKPQVGYLWRKADGYDEVIAMPIVSTETGDVIAAIVLGFKPSVLGDGPAGAKIMSGIWTDGQLHLPSIPAAAQATLAGTMRNGLSGRDPAEGSVEVRLEGTPHLLFYKRLNPDSLYPPAYEVCLYSLADSLARQRRLAWRFAGAGALLLFGALAASRFLSGRLSAPVEKLAAVSERNARFSADASHQLKTPVTVIRVGLEELLAGETLAPAAREEVATLVHQTFRLTSVIEDLLLLSRVDSGRLRLDFVPVNLTRLIEASLDDLGTVPDGLDLQVTVDCPPGLHVAGETRYTTLIVQNLLENARKYNRPGGTVRIAAREDGDEVVLTIGNTGRSISPAAQKHIFERFHRGDTGENVPGHGLGLNLARELARLHGGDLRLVRSDESGTEFEIRFRRAPLAAGSGTKIGSSHG